MAYSRQVIEEILISRLGGWLTTVGKDGTTVGENDDLNDGIGWALRQLGHAVANPVSVDDSDMTGVGADDLDPLLDLAEYRTLISIHQTFGKTDFALGPRRQSFGQMAKRLEGQIAARKKALEDDHGIGESSLQTGTIVSVFASHNEDVV